MTVTLGFLVDRLIVTRLKNHYADNDIKRESTARQIGDLCFEIDGYLAKALAGEVSNLTFAQNKVYKQHTVEVGDPSATMGIGELVAKLIDANHKMWINQEVLYDFERVPEDKRVEVINKCCTLNIERNKYMDAIDSWFAARIASNSR